MFTDNTLDSIDNPINLTGDNRDDLDDPDKEPVIDLTIEDSRVERDTLRDKRIRREASSNQLTL